MHALIDEAAAEGACARVALGRDETSNTYRLEITPLTARPAPRREDLVSVLPPGSRWTPAVGWSAVVGHPVSEGLWALGRVEICPRADGGAHPVARLHLHEGGLPVEPLRRIAGALDPDTTPTQSDPADARVLVQRLEARTPETSLREQAWVVRQAAELWRRGTPTLFKSAILAEDELRPFIQVPARVPAGAERAVIGVPDAVSRSFGLGTAVLLYVRTAWRPG